MQYHVSCIVLVIDIHVLGVTFSGLAPEQLLHCSISVPICRYEFIRFHIYSVGISHIIPLISHICNYFRDSQIFWNISELNIGDGKLVSVLRPGTEPTKNYVGILFGTKHLGVSVGSIDEKIKTAHFRNFRARETLRRLARTRTLCIPVFFFFSGGLG